MTTRGHSKLAIWMVLALTVICLVVFVQSVHKAYRDIGNDFTSYLMSAKALVEGADPYHMPTAFPYIYPLFLALLLVPLAFVPYWLATAVWFLINAVGCALLITIPRILAGEDSNQADRVPAAAPAIITVVALFPVIQNHMLNGQVNFVVAALAALGLVASLHARTWQAAVLLGAAIAIKLVPIVLLVYLIGERQYRTAALALLFATLFCFLPIILTGAEIFHYYQNYFDTFLFAGMSGSQATAAGEAFFTVSGLVRWAVPSLAEFRSVNALAALATVVATVIIHRKSSATGTRTGYLIPWLYFITILLITPSSQTHHLAWMVPGFAGVLTLLMRRHWRGNRTAWVLLGGCVVFLHLGVVMHGGPFFVLSLLSLFSAVTRFALSRDEESTRSGRMRWAHE